MSFKFEFSLEVLNHLGRGLYRNFATVIAEAISNSWDAEATEIHITINTNNKEMTVKDNGTGMNNEDFQGKFLKVGYSRRNDTSNTSSRKVLGRKGIGKLALLSIADKITIVSKKNNSDETGGIIDNNTLDEKIKNDGSYSLKGLENTTIFDTNETGTYLKFESIKDVVNNPEIIKKYLAVLFNFSISNNTEQFDIYVNDAKISTNHLKELHYNTQFLWCIDIEEENARFENFNNLKHKKDLESKSFTNNEINHNIKGYIASVDKPSHLKMRGTGGGFKAGLHLFVNGRLRQEDILKDITSHRVVESYLYGEIHVDAFDEEEDIFTSSREGVLKDNPRYKAFLEKLKELQGKVLADWDEWRSKKNKEDINKKISDYKNLRKDKRELIDSYLDMPEDKRSGKGFEKLMKGLIPKASEKKILVSHASCDKKYADTVYKKLIEIGFSPKDILYTGSTDIDSKLPINQNIFEYLRKFFIQDWHKNPHVIFIVSDNMEKSWFASLEAGAAWVMQTEHNLFVLDRHKPQKPLNIEHIYIEFDEHGEFKDNTDANSIFQQLAQKYEIVQQNV